jgi:heterotetrameric sarcosine oxidase gamma subunit
VSGPDIDTPRFEVVQIAAWRDGSAALHDRLRDAGWGLPPFGAAWCDDDRVACSVRPTRWLLIAPAPPSGTTEPTLAERCETLIGDAGAVTDLSAARCAWRISDPDVSRWLAAGCRLDLHPEAFAVGQAAVTLIAQVPVMVVRRASDWLLIAPSSMAEHVDAWLRSARMYSLTGSWTA